MFVLLFVVSSVGRSYQKRGSDGLICTSRSVLGVCVVGNG